MSQAKQQRKSMKDALHQSAEALAFLKEGASKPAVEREQPDIVEEIAPEVKALEESKVVKSDSVKKVASQTKKSMPPQEESQKVAEGEGGDLLVSVTFRLPENIADNLLRASLTRKLEKKEPHTKQDIAAVALQAWLKKEGYSAS